MNNLELDFSKELDKRNIKWDFEPKTFIIDTPFTSSYKRYMSLKYTPDFMFVYKGQKYIIEVKGFNRYMDANRVKYRFFDKWCMENNIVFLVVKQRGSIKNGTKSFYKYTDNRTIKDYDFWSILDNAK